MSKIDCGSLVRVGKDGVEFRGPVSLGSRLDGFLTLRKHRRAGTSDDHPDYSVEYTPRSGYPRPMGAAWLKNGERAGDFISMTLDDPDWPASFNLSAFNRADGGEEAWVIVWSRPRGTRAQDQHAEGNSG